MQCNARRHLPSSATSSKRRCIDLLQCSEREHNQCWKLLPPSPPLHFCEHLRSKFNMGCPISPLPLCCSCRTLVARCILRAHIYVTDTFVSGVVRVSSHSYDADVGHYTGLFRASIVHRQRQAARKRRKTEEGSRMSSSLQADVAGLGSSADCYILEAHHCVGSAVYRIIDNVCDRCHCGLTSSQYRYGHDESCVCIIDKHM